MDYQGALDLLEGLQPEHIDLTTERIAAAAQHLHRPQDQFPIVHIAGTNGKGSTAAFLASLLRQSGYKVGMYTSPHLIEVRERIQVAGGLISPEDLTRLVADYRSVAERYQLTYFEFLTLLSWIYFGEQEVDIAILEVGLGGRFDATNVVTPLGCALTPIGLDHLKHLGRALNEVAREKCGIIKAGIPVVSAPQADEVRQIIEERCRELRAPLHGADENLVPAGINLGLPGRHQRINAGVALKIGELLKARGWRIEVGDALSKTRWPGRLQLISTNPDVIVDGAHNPMGMRAVAEFIEERYAPHPEDETGRQPRIAGVLGMFRDKPVEEMLSAILPGLDLVWATSLNHSRALAAAELARRVRPKGKKCYIAPSVVEAIAEAKQKIPPDGVIMVTGSLYLAGEVLITESTK